MPKYFLLIFMLFLLTSCRNLHSDSTQKEVGILYTNANLPDSAYLVLDKHGKTISQTNIPAMGMFQVTKGNKSNLLFPVQFSDQLYTLHPSGNLKKTKILPYPLFTKEMDGFRVTTYNSSLNSGTVEWSQAGQTTQVKLDGFPRVATFDQKHIFVFCTIIKQKQAVLYILSRTTNKIEKTICLATDQANDLEILNHKLWISSIANQNRIALLDLTTWKVTYLSLPEPQPEFFLPIDEKLLITYQGNSSITVLNQKTLRIEEQVTLPQPVFKAKKHGNQLYVLSLIPGKGQGIIGVYNLSNWKLDHKILLPIVRNTITQDFFVY